MTGPDPYYGYPDTDRPDELWWDFAITPQESGKDDRSGDHQLAPQSAYLVAQRDISLDVEPGDYLEEWVHDSRQDYTYTSLSGNHP